MRRAYPYGALAATVLALILSAPTTAAWAASTSVVVNNATGASCSDSSTGVPPAVPLCTVTAAATKAPAGATVTVKAGSYAGGAVVANGGTSGAPTVFAADPGVTLTGGTYGFKIAKSYVTVSGFGITGTTSFGVYVVGTSTASLSGVTVSGNSVSFAGHPVSGQLANGIRLTYVTGATVSGNKTYQNSDTGIYLTTGATSNTVRGNESWLNANQYQRNANGINVVAAGNTLIGNLVHDNEDSGLQFYTGGDNNLAVDNVSYNNGDHGIDDLNVTGGRLINNTVYHNCTSGINVEGTSGNYLVENNISVDNAVFLVNPTPMNGYTNTCQRRAGNIGIWDSAPSGTTVDHNLVYLSTGTKLYAWSTSTYTTLAAFRTASGQAAHDAVGNPLWVNPAAGDFHLGAGSPAIGRADPTVSGWQPTDYYGAAWIVSVGGATDAGAVTH